MSRVFKVAQRGQSYDDEGKDLQDIEENVRWRRGHQTFYPSTSGGKKKAMTHWDETFA